VAWLTSGYPLWPYQSPTMPPPPRIAPFPWLDILWILYDHAEEREELRREPERQSLRWRLIFSQGLTISWPNLQAIGSIKVPALVIYWAHCARTSTWYDYVSFAFGPTCIMEKIQWTNSSPAATSFINAHRGCRYCRGVRARGRRGRKREKKSKVTTSDSSNIRAIHTSVPTCDMPRHNTYQISRSEGEPVRAVIRPLVGYLRFFCQHGKLP
jgi:hypothetical protein